MKLTKLAIATAVCSAALSFSAFAGGWVAGDGENQGRWWYDNGDGTYLSDGWQWIDGNGDGVSESYCFDTQGWLLTNTVTPDGYTVDGNRAWTVNGVVQTQGTLQNNAAETTNTGAVTVSDGKYSLSRMQIFDSTTNTLLSDVSGSGYFDFSPAYFSITRDAMNFFDCVEITNANDGSLNAYFNPYNIPYTNVGGTYYLSEDHYWAPETITSIDANTIMTTRPFTHFVYTSDDDRLRDANGDYVYNHFKIVGYFTK